MRFSTFFTLFGLVIGLELDTEDDTVAAFIPEQMIPLGICKNRDSYGYPTCVTHKKGYHTLFIQYFHFVRSVI